MYVFAGKLIDLQRGKLPHLVLIQQTARHFMLGTSYRSHCISNMRKQWQRNQVVTVLILLLQNLLDY